MQDLGYSKSGSMGAVALDWVDIKAFSDLTGIVFSKEEAILIKKLSEDFVSQQHESKYTDTIAPYIDDDVKGADLDKLFDTL